MRNSNKPHDFYVHGKILVKHDTFFFVNILPFSCAVFIPNTKCVYKVKQIVKKASF